MNSVPAPAAAVKAARPPRKPTKRTARLYESAPGKLALCLTEWFARTARATVYHVAPVACDYGAGFELRKLLVDGGEVYHVHLDAQLGNTCDCKGFLRWSRCKHVDCVAELVRRGNLKPAAPARPAPAAVSTAPALDDL